MRGRSIVCLHGLRRSPADWDGVIAEMPSSWAHYAPALPPDPALALQVADGSIADGDVVFAHSMGAVIALRLLEARPRDVAALVLTGSFFPPARNGRSLRSTTRDYLAHRVAYLHAARRRPTDTQSAGTRRALASLVRQAVRPRGGPPEWLGRPIPVLVVHAGDDHHVPVDFAIAAAARHPSWTRGVFDTGGHHLHVSRSAEWLARVSPWLDDVLADD